MQPRGRLGGRFELLVQAGAGASSRVYQAQDTLDGDRLVAVKVLAEMSEEAVERFEREARLLASLDHPAVVRYIAHGKTEKGSPWLALEWLAGCTLAARLDERPLTVVEAVSLARPILTGLDALHARGVVHRDVKPANIMLVNGEPSRAKLLDLGVARFLHAPVELTMKGQLIGTPAYLAPEQARGSRSLDGKVDLFALGVVLHRALTGRRPFDAPDTLELLLKILFDEPPRLSALIPDVPPQLDELCVALLAKKPEQRPSAKEALAAVVALEAQSRKSPGVSAPRQTTARGVVPGRGLSLAERKTVCLAVARCHSASLEATRSGVARAEKELQQQGVALSLLADGSFLLAPDSPDSAKVDTPIMAARAALAFASWVPDVAVAVASVRMDVADNDLEKTLGHAAERAARMLTSGPNRFPRIDEVTRALLGQRFRIQSSGDTNLLIGEVGGPRESLSTIEQGALVGRERELAILRSEFTRSRESPRIFALLGVAGIGKSRLAAEVLSWAAAESRIVHVARAEPMSSGGPLSMLAQILRSCAKIDPTEPKLSRQKKLTVCVARALGRESPVTAAFLGELIGTRFDDDELAELRAARIDARLMGDRIQRAFTEWLGGECRRQRVILLLEDLHWGDVASVRLVAEAAFQLDGSPLLVLGLSRPDAPREILLALGGLSIELEALSRADALRLVRSALGESASDELATRVVDRAEGNALFLEEIVRACRQGRGDELPEAVLVMIQHRLAGLSASSRRLMRAASVFGARFQAEGLSGMLPDVDSATLRATLDELVLREVLVPVPESDDSPTSGYAFRHALIRDAAYAMLAEDDRRFAHRAAAQWLERSGVASQRAVAAHYEQGELQLQAAGAYRGAAQQALEGNDFRCALELAGRAIALGSQGIELGELRLLMAEALRWCGEHKQAAQAADEALPLLAPESGAWYAALGELALASGRIARIDELERVVQLLGAANAPTDRHALARRRIAAARTAIHLITGGQLAKAMPLYRELEQNADDDDDAVSARVQQTAAFVALLSGDLHGYLLRMVAATAAFERAGDLREAAIQRVNVGNASLQLGMAEQAESALDSALVAGKQMRLSNIVAYAEHNLGILRARRGAPRDGLELEERAREAFAAQGDRRMEGVSRIYSAQILLLLARSGDAIDEANLALSLLEQSLPAKACAMATKAAALLAAARSAKPFERAARRAEALQVALAAHEILEQLGALEEGEFLVRTTLVEALLVSERTNEAGAAAQVAYTRLLERASRIMDPIARERFLTQVPDNARALELVDQLVELGVPTLRDPMSRPRKV